MTNSYVEEFCASYNLKNLIKQTTCFQNLENPTWIDSILTNHPKSFQSRKDNIAGNLFAYKRQRTLCVKLLRKSQKVF